MFSAESVPFWTALQALVSLGSVVALLLVWRQILQVHEITKHNVYEDLDESFVTFVRRAADGADLGLTDMKREQIESYARQHGLSFEQAMRRLLNFATLFSLWEHAYLDLKRQWMEYSQWTGWEDWMRSYLNEDHVRDAWFIAGRTFDADFSQFIADAIRDCLGHDRKYSFDKCLEKCPPLHNRWPEGLLLNSENDEKDANQRRENYESALECARYEEMKRARKRKILAWLRMWLRKLAMVVRRSP